MPYEYLEEIGTADIAFEATGRDLPELFRDAADATTNVMIDNIEAIQPRETRQIELSNDKLDMLLFDLLQELIFLKDAERLLLRMREVQIDRERRKLFCEGNSRGRTARCGTASSTRGRESGDASRFLCRANGGRLEGESAFGYLNVELRVRRQAHVCFRETRRYDRYFASSAT